MNSHTMPPRPSRIPLSVVPNVGVPKDGVVVTEVMNAMPVIPPSPPVNVVSPSGRTSGSAKSRTMIIANAAIVTAYKVAGFVVLVFILGGLFSYLGVHAFYFANSSWVVPTVMSPNDDRVLRISSQVAQESVRRDALLAQRLELDTQYSDANRVAITETSFQAAFKVALDTDLATRKNTLSRFQGLLVHYTQTKQEIDQASQAYAGMSKDRFASDFGAHLIDKDAMVNGSFQLAQLAGANLALDERSVELNDRIAALRHDVGSLRTASTHAAVASAELSYDVVRMQHELEVSVLTSKRANEDVVRLASTMGMIDKSLRDYDALITRLGSSPYAVAADGRANVAFVPYANKKNVSEGAPIYGCKVTLVGCSVVGHVGAVIEGEVVDRHPVTGHDVRGVMVRLVLSDPHAAENAVLHVGRAPLFI